MINTIETPADHERALREIAALIEAHPKPGTTESARLEVLGALLEAYEDEHFPIWETMVERRQQEPRGVSLAEVRRCYRR